MLGKTSSPYETIGLRRIATAVLLILVFAGLGVWLFEPGYESTNDAQIEGHIHPINARVAGTVVWVNPIVDDTHFVRAGTILARLDRNDYEPTVNRLEGDVQSSEAQLESARLNVHISEATYPSRLASARAAVDEAVSERQTAQAQSDAARESLAEASALYKRAEDDRRRYEALMTTHEISRSEYDQRATEAATAEAQMRAAAANLTASQERIASATKRIAEREEDVRSAMTAPQQIAAARSNVQRADGDLKRNQASLKDANLNLGYTEVNAPVDGIIGRKQLEVGERVTVGQLLLTLSPRKDLWAIANFKETQLQKMRLGQPATIHVDASGKDYQGTIESLGGSTGARSALIPPDNATGNYVKVVQRVPVRIRIQTADDGFPLLPGMSVEAKIKTAR